AARFALDSWARTRIPGKYHASTPLINVGGSLLIGLVVGVASVRPVSDTWVAILGVGMLGGFTTFSTISVETIALMRERNYRCAAAHSAGVLLASVLAAALGVWLGAATVPSAQPEPTAQESTPVEAPTASAVPALP